jgi:hypothetical protein
MSSIPELTLQTSSGCTDMILYPMGLQFQRRPGREGYRPFGQPWGIKTSEGFDIKASDGETILARGYK